MSSSAVYYEKERLENAVRTLCPIIERQVCAGNFKATSSEYAIRQELVACILGSRVKHEIATSAVERLDNAGLLDDNWWNGRADQFELRVFNVLSGRTSRSNDHWCYRFPKARARNIAEARDFLAKHSLSERLLDAADPKEKRQWLVTHISGLGPKQASMFLRNIGVSYNLAILDTHVLRFLEIQNLLNLRPAVITNIRAYERTEQIITNYAKSLGYSVGCLDWAIWAPMRAARELGL